MLEEPEPNQREFLSNWQHYSTRATPAGTETVSEDVRARLWETPPNTDKFVDEWARYTAGFEAVGRDLTYKRLTSKKKDSGSLAEYALYPPEGREDVAAALKAALESFAQCIQSAKTTNQLVKKLPEIQRKGDKAVRKQKNQTYKARARRSLAKNAAKRHRQDREYAARAAREDAEVRQRINKLYNDVEKATGRADTKINDFAVERTVTLGHTETAREHLERLGGSEGRTAPAAPSRIEALPLPNDTVTREFRRLLDRHHIGAKGLTTVGLNELRKRTLSEIEELLTGKSYTLRLEVENIVESRDGGYVLTAAHRPDCSDRVVENVEFLFGGDLKRDLVYCRVGANVEVEARVKRVSLLPGLPALEASNEPARVRVTGDVTSVKEGCRAY